MPTWFQEGARIKGKSQQTAVKTGNGAKHELRNVPELVPMAAFPIHIPAKFKTVCPSSPPHPHFPPLSPAASSHSDSFSASCCADVGSRMCARKC